MAGLDTYDLLLRGAAIGGVTAIATGLCANLAHPAHRWAAALFFASVAAHVLNTSPLIVGALDWFAPPLALFAMGSAGYVWLFVAVMFEDRALSPILFAPAFALTIIGAASVPLETILGPAVWIGHNFIEIAITAHALWIVVSSWGSDLVGFRRQLRGAFLTAVLCYSVLISLVGIAEIFDIVQPWFSLVGAITTAALAAAGSFVFLEPRRTLFVPIVTVPQVQAAVAVPTETVLDDVGLARLNEIMDQEEIWREEGISIGTLAEKMAMPEHRLRSLINENLGFRNFPTFVNTRRIEAAKRVLADPAHAHKNVSSIAYDLGFGSLGPFNRAFKDVTGMSPTEYRRQALAEASPNLQKAP